jgi:hypothetical protein
MWRDVTLNLKLKDIDMATEAKHYLEEKQRGEARERKENERQWETRVSLLLLLLLLLLILFKLRISSCMIFLCVWKYTGRHGSGQLLPKVKANI